MIIGQSSAVENTIRALCLEHVATEIDSREVLAALARRAAVTMCPCHATMLVDAIAVGVKHLVNDELNAEDLLDLIDDLVDYGDLVEVHNTDSPTRSVLLYALPPAFVRCTETRVLLTGVMAEGEAALVSSTGPPVWWKNHIRGIDGPFAAELHRQLLGLGFFELPLQAWLDCPLPKEPHVLLRSYIDSLRPADGVDVSQFHFLGPAKTGTTYKNRWRQMPVPDGYYVARRAIRWNGYIWCFARVLNQKLVGLIGQRITGLGRAAAVSHTLVSPRTGWPVDLP